MKLPIASIGQRDSRWRNTLLGTSTVSTIGGYGCALVCCAMTAKYYGKDTDPLKLNEDLKRVKAFYNGSYLNWNGVTDIYPDIKFTEYYACLDVPCDLKKIDDRLMARHPVIACVDFDYGQRGLQTHFVLIIGKENNSYIINDPWTAEQYFFEAKYGDPARYIFGLRIFDGPVPQEQDEKYRVVYKGQTLKTYETNPLDIIRSLEQERDRENKDKVSCLATKHELEMALEKQEADNEDLLSQAHEATKERDDAIARQKECEVWLGDYYSLLGVDTPIEVKNKIKELLDRPSQLALKDVKLERLIKEVIRRIWPL